MALVTNRSIYIHVQKTGGMTIRRAMALCTGPCWESGPPEVERHFGLPELRAAHPGIDENRYTFGFVRHPVAWLRSRWAWARASSLMAQARHRPSAASLWVTSCWADDFETFIRNYLERYPWSDRPAKAVGLVENLANDLGICTQTHFRMLGLISILHIAGEVFDEGKIRSLEKFNATNATDPLPRDLESQVLKAESVMVERFYPDR